MQISSSMKVINSIVLKWTFGYILEAWSYLPGGLSVVSSCTSVPGGFRVVDESTPRPLTCLASEGGLLTWVSMKN